MFVITILPFFFFLLPVIAHRNHPATSSATTSTLRAHTPTCWDDTTRFLPIVFRECISIIRTDIISTGHDPDQPLKFSHDPNYHPDIQLPRYWKRAGVNCGVGLDFAPRLQGYDRTTLRDVEAAAMAVAVECVIKPPHTGGYVRLGWYDRLGVLISGARSRMDPENGTLLDWEE
ncbi:MAG: hypothetical protein Q9184_006043 [Pyrenodesmia sp. 2 TL-2023]